MLLLLAAPLAAELLEATIVFEGTGCVTCAESLEPRLARIRGVEKVELDLDHSTVRVALEEGNKARIGPLRLRITQDGTKIVSMRAVVRGVAAKSGEGWTLTVSGPGETLALTAAAGAAYEDGARYRVTGAIVEDGSGALALEAESAEPAQ
ncbi:MAG: cation transporter [Bryobacterales bacterium]|nr:cation transporter [Bryobacterales bacterium]